MEKIKLKFDIYNSTLDDIEIDNDVDTDSLNKLMDELGINMSSKNEDTYKLLLWNDEVNSMEYVMGCLMKICKISVEDSFKVMIEAHTKGKSVAKTGNYDEIYSMKDALNKLNLEATVEK